MGLEPLRATALVMDDDEIPGTNFQCNIEPNTPQGFSWMFTFLCNVLMISFLILLGWIYKRADDGYKSFEGLYTDVAVIESFLHTSRLKLEQNGEEITRLREAHTHTEFSGELEMISDTLWKIYNAASYRLEAIAASLLFLQSRGAKCTL